MKQSLFLVSLLSLGAYANVLSLVTSGSGCSQGVVPAITEFPNTGATQPSALQVSFDTTAYVASTGPPAGQRKNCQVIFVLEKVNGKRYRVSTARYTGNVNLAAGVTAEQGAIYYFQGESTTVATLETFVGPVSSAYNILAVVPERWSSCNNNLAFNVGTSVRVLPGATAAGSITGDVNGKVTFLFNLEWEDC